MRSTPIPLLLSRIHKHYQFVFTKIEKSFSRLFVFRRRWNKRIAPAHIREKKSKSPRKKREILLACKPAKICYGEVRDNFEGLWNVVWKMCFNGTGKDKTLEWRAIYVRAVDGSRSLHKCMTTFLTGLPMPDALLQTGQTTFFNNWYSACA